MPRVTSTVPRFTLIVAVGLIALLLPVLVFASGEDTPVVPDPGLPGPMPLALATVSLTCLDGTTACHLTTLRASIAGNNVTAASITKMRWKKGDADWLEYNYTTQQGPTPPVATWGVWNATAHCIDGGFGTWQAGNITWQFQVTVHVTIGGMPPRQEDDDSDTCSVQVKNTVVTAGTDVLIHQLNGTHQISWNIDHKALTGISFTVTITITNTVGGGTVRTFQKTQTGIGPGNWTWDGKNAMGQDPGAGIYAYTVSATDGPTQCTDQDKSTALSITVNDSKFYYVAKNVQAGTLTVMVRYTLSEDASNCTIRFYGPALGQPLGELDNQPATGTVVHESDQTDISAVDGNGNIVTPVYCVIWATESDARAALNRGLDHKQALQKGTTTLEKSELGLKELTYSGATGKFSTVARDYLGDYAAPHWQDNSDPINHQADDGDENPANPPPPGQTASDRKYPVCYVQGATITAAVKMAIPPWKVTGAVKIKGTGPDNLTFPETAATLQDPLYVATINCQNPLPAATVADRAPLTIHWYISGDGGTTWLDAGSSDNEVFVVLHDIPYGATLYRTALHLATENGGTDDATCTTNTWNAFAGPAGVCAWDKTAKTYTRPLYYYKTMTTSVKTFFDWPPPDDGQCSAWADLLQKAFAANGITSQTTEVDPPGQTDDGLIDEFGVKNISFPENHRYDLPWGYAQNDLDITIAGLAGQHTNPPQAKLFNLHYIVHQGTTYYDPSYGTTTTGAAAYTGAAIAAWGRSNVNRWRDAAGNPYSLAFH